MSSDFDFLFFSSLPELTSSLSLFFFTSCSQVLPYLVRLMNVVIVLVEKKREKETLRINK